MKTAHLFTYEHFTSYRLEVDHDRHRWTLWQLDGDTTSTPAHTGRWDPFARSVTFDDEAIDDTDPGRRTVARRLQARIVSFLPQPIKVKRATSTKPLHEME